MYLKFWDLQHYKKSRIGRMYREAALQNYTKTKDVRLNLGLLCLKQAPCKGNVGQIISGQSRAGMQCLSTCAGHALSKYQMPAIAQAWGELSLGKVS